MTGPVLLCAELTPAHGFPVRLVKASSAELIPRVVLLQVQDLQAMEWGMSTNFDEVFDLILQQAVKAKLPQEQMIQQVVCYSDMEFNVSRGLMYDLVTATDAQQPHSGSAGD